MFPVLSTASVKRSPLLRVQGDGSWMTGYGLWSGLTLARLGHCADGPSQPRDEIYYLFSSLHLLSILLNLARYIPEALLGPRPLTLPRPLHSYPLPGGYQLQTQSLAIPLSLSLLAAVSGVATSTSHAIELTCRKNTRCWFTASVCHDTNAWSSPRPSHGITHS